MLLPFTIVGEVLHGNRIGRRLGFPTANVSLAGFEGVEDGVYVVRITVLGQRHDGVANIGSRPTVTQNPERFLEVYIFDFDGNIYGQQVEVELLACLRPELKFDTVEALREQMEQDKAEARQFLKRLGGGRS